MIKKAILIASLLLNIVLLILIFQLRDKIFTRIFSPEKTMVLMVGDSRIAQENWSDLLGRNDVKNEAFGGAITQQILWNIERGQLNSEPKIVVLEGGINDILSGIPPQRVYENYVKMIKILRTKKIKIIINSTLYTADKQDINSNIFILNSILRDYCNNHKITWLDMNEQLSEDGTLLKKYSLDGIHLNKEAYLIWAKKLNDSLSHQ